ncbi:glycoside hydrolase family 117 protein [Wenyingzhuangia sp. IMCC45574]
MRVTILVLVLFLSICSCSKKAQTESQIEKEVLSDFPFGNVPREKPNRPLSKSTERIYEGSIKGFETQNNELFTTFKYTPLKGLDYSNGDGTVSRRDVSKVIKANGKYYVWYTHRDTSTPPYNVEGNDTIPARDWDLAEIWYATSKDGFTWEEQGVAVERMEKPHAGWRSVSTPDILVYKEKYYLYYQAYLNMPGSQKKGLADACPVSVSYADSPNGPWTPSNKVVVPNGPEGSWDSYVIHDPYPIVYNNKIYLYYKGEMGGNPRVRAQGLAISDDPIGTFKKHPLNPVINSGHETALFPFKEGVAAIVSRHGLEHNTIQYSPDGVNFEIASISSLFPIAPGGYIPDVFTNTDNGRGLTWGLCHFRDVGRPDGKSHSILARFDCDLSLDVNRPEMKESDYLNHPEVYFTFGLSNEEKERTKRENTLE